MITTTSEHVAGKQVVKTLGIVRGNTVRARNIGRARPRRSDYTSMARSAGRSLDLFGTTCQGWPHDA